jgi:hypothetical protein
VLQYAGTVMFCVRLHNSAVDCWLMIQRSCLLKFIMLVNKR